MADKAIREILAFDQDLIHKGNKGLNINHEEVQLKVDTLLERMTLTQKLNQISGQQAKPIEGLYFLGEDEELGISPFKMVDGPRGARAGKATAFPVSIARAATFDVELERRVGSAIGLEVAAKGGNVLLAPTINLLRHPCWGRAQETYSEDSFHTGAMGAAFISGAQNHVLASPKHLAANNVEVTRFEMSANMSARVLHEVYLPHFKRCIVEAGAASVMSAYNKLNGVYCGENQVLLTDILRKDWGFKGFVESDWYLGTRSTAAALRAGLDIEMPVAYHYKDKKIHEALENGELNEDAITLAASRVLYQNIAWDLANIKKPSLDLVECQSHIDLAREVAEKSIVLLKNDSKILPISDKEECRIAVLGNLAGEVNLGDRGSSFVTSSEVTTPLEGILQRAEQSKVRYFSKGVKLGSVDKFDLTIVIVGLTYIDEGEFIPTAQQEAESDDLARGGDRSSMSLPEPQLDYIRNAIEYSKKTIVIIEGGSAIEVRDWIDDVDALLHVWYPGREGGHAIANVLFGDVNPSGKLPVTVPKNMNQLPLFDLKSLEVEHDYLQGYRYVLSTGDIPEFGFGFGLSYTTFQLDELSICRTEHGFEVTVRIENDGECDGATVAQLYLSYPDSVIPRAPIELKGFGRVELKAGESARLIMEVQDDDLKYYDQNLNSWVLEDCSYQFSMGFSSLELGLHARWQFVEDSWTEKVILK